MSNETFKTVFWGLQPQAVHKELEQLKNAHQEKVDTLQAQLTELTTQRDALLREKEALEQTLALPELSPRFIELAQNRIERTEALLKNAAEKDKNSIQQEYQTRHIANEVKRQQIEDSIRQCREQFQSMMAGLNRMASGSIKNGIKNSRPNLVVVETLRDQPNNEEEQELAGKQDLTGKQSLDLGYQEAADLSPEVLRYQYACGKKAGQDILLEDGQLLIGRGETITLEVVKAANEHDKLSELVKNMEVPEFKETV